jgi:hypothetical protein
MTLTGVYYSSVSFGDYDNDNDLDIFLAGDAIHTKNFICL